MNYCLSSLEDDVQYCVSPKAGGKTFLVHVKLTESCAKALESVQRQSHLSIWFAEDGGGFMTAPCENGEVQKFELVSGSGSDKTSLDCLIQKREAGGTVVQTLGSIDHKITIKATDEVYETTKLRATQLEKVRKEARAKEIKVATSSKLKSSSNHKSTVESHRSTLHTDTHPRSMGGATDHPRTMGGATDHPRSMGGATDHPRSMGGATDHPRSMGGATDHPRSMGGATDHPRSMGVATDHPRSMGGATDHSRNMGVAQDYPRTGFESHRTERSNFESHRINAEIHRPNLETHKPKVPIPRNPTPPVIKQESPDTTSTSEDQHRSVVQTPSIVFSESQQLDHTDTESDTSYKMTKSRHHAIVTETSSSSKDRHVSPALGDTRHTNVSNSTRENVASSYAQDYPALTNVKQRLEYKLIFNKEYKLYLSLKQAFDEVQAEVNELSRQFRNCEDKRKAKVIKRRVKQKYFEVQNDISYRERKQQLLLLHAKLEHIKKMITDYDQLQ